MFPSIRAAKSEKFRFLIAGASTTLFSYVLYLLLLRWIQPMPAYIVAYVAGIVWAYSFNSVWVFRGRWTWKGLTAYPLVYVVQMIVSFAIFALLISRLHLPVVIAPLIIVVIMLPVSYLLGRWIIYHTSGAGPGRDD